MRKILARFAAYCRDIWRRFVKFGIVGASGTVVDLGVIFGLNAVFADVAADFLPRNIIQIVGYEISVFTNYLLSFFWVWKDQHGQFLRNLVKYNLSTALAFTLRMILFNLGMTLAGPAGRENMLVYYSVFFFSLGAAVLMNFLMIHHKVFIRTNANGN